MLLARNDLPFSSRLTLADGEVIEIEACEVVVDGGVLVFRGKHGGILRAFGPNAWLEVGKAQ